MLPLAGIFNWRGPASSSSFVAKTAHVAFTPVLAPVLLSQCKHQHALLNGTYGDCTEALDDTLADLTHFRTNLASVKLERDNALVQGPQ